MNANEKRFVALEVVETATGYIVQRIPLEGLQSQEDAEKLLQALLATLDRSLLHVAMVEQ